MATGSRTKSRTSKAEQSRATRRRIVAAATTLFLRDGFLTTTMAAVAQEAGVVVQTLYLSFGNKTKILKAAFDTAIVGDDEPVPIFDRDWFVSAQTNPDGPAALAAFVHGTSAVMQRSTPLYNVIRAAAAEPEVAELLSNNKRERHAGFTQVAQAIASRKGFAPDLAPADAAGVLYAVQSEETFALLVLEHGWSPQQWEEWVLQTLLRQFFPDEAG